MAVAAPPTVDMANASRALADMDARLAAAGDDAVIDLAGVQRFDSALLAMLLELRRRRGAAGIRLTGVPDKLLSLARLYGVDELLFGPGVGPAR
ncbi:MAG: lipid asymmetry maintenance protein MlaB [Lautropia sp.]